MISMGTWKIWKRVDVLLKLIEGNMDVPDLHINSRLIRSCLVKTCMFCENCENILEVGELIVYQVLPS